jgi:hypothetical protein
MATKNCTGCRELKPLSAYHKCARSNDGHDWYCIACKKTIRRRTYLKNREKTLSDNARWRDANRLKMRALAKDWKARNPDRFRELVKRWYSRPAARIHASVATRIRDTLAGKKLGRGVEVIIGYKIAELVAHLERQFLRGMTWANYGDWHIDHITPLASFAAAEIRAAWALPNLRPLWAIDNQRKHAQRTHLV